MAKGKNNVKQAIREKVFIFLSRLANLINKRLDAIDLQNGPGLEYVVPTRPEQANIENQRGMWCLGILATFGVLGAIFLFAQFCYTVFAQNGISFAEWNSSSGSFWGCNSGGTCRRHSYRYDNNIGNQQKLQNGLSQGAFRCPSSF